MREWTKQRRKAILLSSSGVICAASPILLGDRLHRGSHDFLVGLAIAVSAQLLIASVITMRRGRGCY